MSDVDRANHWATILGCDPRAGIEEIGRARDRRLLELRGLHSEGRCFAIGRVLDAYKAAESEKQREARVA